MTSLKIDLNNNSKGILQIVGATILWGIGYPIWKTLAGLIPPLSLTTIGFLIAAIAMLPLYRLNLAALWLKLKPNAALLVLLGLSGGLLGTGLIYYALSIIDSGVAALLEKLQPVFAVLAARLFLAEQISIRQVPFMLLALFFSFIIAIPNPLSFSFASVHSLGILAAIGSSMFYGFNTVICKYLVNSKIYPRELAFFRMSIGGIIALPVALYTGDFLQDLVQIDLSIWLLLLLGIGISLIWAFDLFLTGLQTVPAGVATFLELLTPLVALSLGVFLLEETVTWIQLFAIPPFAYCILRISKPIKPIEAAIGLPTP